jgi:hypothetical protein
MHPPLHRPHPSCQDVIDGLTLCHAANPSMKFFGWCNEAKADLDWCFREEKEMIRALNQKNAGKESKGTRHDWQSEWNDQMKKDQTKK